MAYFGSNPFADQFQAIPTLPASTRGQFTQGQPPWQDMFLRRMAGLFEPGAGRSQGFGSPFASGGDSSMPYFGAPTQGRASPGGYGQNINALRSLFAGPIAYGNDVGTSGAFMGPPQGGYGADVLESLKGGGGGGTDTFTNILQNANALRSAAPQQSYGADALTNALQSATALRNALPGGYGNDVDSSGSLGAPGPMFGGPGASRREQLFAGASQVGNALRLVQQAGGPTQTAEAEEAFKLAQPGGGYGNDVGFAGPPAGTTQGGYGADVFTNMPQGGYRADISEGPPNLTMLPTAPRFRGPGASRGKGLTPAGSGGLFRNFIA
jgi:hypothetical protein